MSLKKKQTHLLIIIGVVAAAVLAYFLLVNGPTGRGSRINKSNVLVITLDTTRADRIGAYGYKKGKSPHIDALAREGVLFSEAISSVPITLPSHCSIFTGTTVLYHQVRNNGSYFLPAEIDTLAEVLKGHNYSTSAFISSFTLDSRFGMDQGFDTYDDTLILNQTMVKTFDSERPAAAVFKSFSHWLQENRKNKFFSWVHFYDPNLPYSPPEPYRSQFQNDLYDGEIAYVDEYVGKIIALLKEKGVWRNTLIIVAGDHGEAFGEHGEMGHGIFCYQETLRVPLIITDPSGSLSPRVISRRVNLTDIMPTLLEYLKIDTPTAAQGISLLPLIRKNKADERAFYIESVMANEALACAEVKGIIKDDYKFIDLPNPELYHLPTDPLEKKNLFLEKNHMIKQIRQDMAELVKKYKTSKSSAKRELSAEEIKKLRSLGYLSSGTKKGGSKKLADPKEKIGSWNEFTKGTIAFSQGLSNEASQHFRQSIELNADFSEPYAMLAYINFNQGNIAEAEAFYKKGIELNPEDYIVRIEYIKLLISKGDLSEALIKLRELERLKLIAFEVQIFNLSGISSMRTNKNAEAIYYFRKALEIEP